MSLATNIVWSPSSSNTDVISSLQNYSGAGNMIINSNEFTSQVTKSGPYRFEHVLRTVSFTSANDLSSRNITINGIGSAVDANGNPTQPLNTPVSETISGPNANTVYTSTIYRQIDSISIDGAANGLSAGFGKSGITTYVFPDYDRTGWYASFQTAIYNHTTLTHTVYVSLTKPDVFSPTTGKFIPYPYEIPAFPIGTVDSAVNQLISTQYPLAVCWANIKNNDDETLYFTVLQQGIR